MINNQVAADEFHFFMYTVYCHTLLPYDKTRTKICFASQADRCSFERPRSEKKREKVLTESLLRSNEGQGGGEKLIYPFDCSSSLPFKFDYSPWG